MRTLAAVLSGFLVASALILAGQWGYSALAKPAMHGEYFITTFPAAVLALLYSCASVVVGGWVATRVQDTSEAFSGFSVFQLFFGLGLVRAFWRTGFSWYSVAALVLVIPSAMIGRAIARRMARGNLVGAV